MSETPPADGDLRDLIEAHIAQVYDRSCAANVARAAMAIVGPKLERLRGDQTAMRNALAAVIVDLAEQRQRAEQAESVAAEWQAACEAHQADGEALMAAIERARVVSTTWMRRAGNITGANEGETFPDLMAIRDARAGVLRDCTRDIRAALDAPSGAHSPASGRTGVLRHTETTHEAGEAQEATE